MRRPRHWWTDDKCRAESWGVDWSRDLPGGVSQTVSSQGAGVEAASQQSFTWHRRASMCPGPGVSRHCLVRWPFHHTIVSVRVGINCGIPKIPNTRTSFVGYSSSLRSAKVIVLAFGWAVFICTPPDFAVQICVGLSKGKIKYHIIRICVSMSRKTSPFGGNPRFNEDKRDIQYNNY